MEILLRIDFWALIVAVGTAFWTYFNTKKLNMQQLQLNQLNIDKAISDKEIMKYADIKIKVSKVSINKDHKTYQLEIKNSGPGVARNIKLIFNQEKAKDKGLHLVGEGNSVFPILNKEDSFTKIVLFDEGHENVHLIKIIWDDSRIGFSKDQALEFS